MLFNSYLFIFIFLPFTLLGWYGLNHYKRYELAKKIRAGKNIPDRYVLMVLWLL